MLAVGMPEDWQPPGFIGGSLANGEPRLSLEHRQRLWAAEQHPDAAFRTLERKRVSRLVTKRAATVCDAHVARVAALAAGQQLLQQLYRMQEQALVIRTLQDATQVEKRAAAALLTIEREWLSLGRETLTRLGLALGTMPSTPARLARVRYAPAPRSIPHPGASLRRLRLAARCAPRASRTRRAPGTMPSRATCSRIMSSTDKVRVAARLHPLGDAGGMLPTHGTRELRGPK